MLRGWPKAITVDNGTEFTSRALDDWAYRHGVKLDYTRPGKPTDNGLIESFNGRLRDEFLNVHEFVTLYDLREKMRVWQHDYNHHRPHGSPGHLTPSEFVLKWSVQPRGNCSPVLSRPLSGGTSITNCLFPATNQIPGVHASAPRSMTRVLGACAALALFGLSAKTSPHPTATNH